MEAGFAVRERPVTPAIRDDRRAARNEFRFQHHPD
jgi:hypothetical protein